MSKKFPPEFISIWHQSGLKFACVSENQQEHPWDCPNCGGRGFLTTFIASDGPFKAPSAKGTNHFDKDYWWSGTTYTADCPVCKGAR